MGEDNGLKVQQHSVKFEKGEKTPVIVPEQVKKTQNASKSQFLSVSTKFFSTSKNFIFSVPGEISSKWNNFSNWAVKTITEWKTNKKQETASTTSYNIKSKETTSLSGTSSKQEIVTEKIKTQFEKISSRKTVSYEQLEKATSEYLIDKSSEYHKLISSEKVDRIKVDQIKHETKFIASQLNKIVQNLPKEIKSSEDLKIKLKNEYKSNNELKESIDRDTFVDLSNNKFSYVAFSLINAPEYEQVNQLYKNEQWKDGEEKTITFTEIRLDKIDQYNDAIDKMFADPTVQAVLSQFLPSVKPLTDAINEAKNLKLGEFLATSNIDHQGNIVSLIALSNNDNAVLGLNLMKDSPEKQALVKLIDLCKKNPEDQIKIVNALSYDQRENFLLGNMFEQLRKSDLLTKKTDDINAPKDLSKLQNATVETVKTSSKQEMLKKLDLLNKEIADIKNKGLNAFEQNKLIESAVKSTVQKDGIDKKVYEFFVRKSFVKDEEGTMYSMRDVRTMDPDEMRSILNEHKSDEKELFEKIIQIAKENPEAQGALQRAIAGYDRSKTDALKELFTQLTSKDPVTKKIDDIYAPKTPPNPDDTSSEMIQF